jgi:hypothetical protein
LRELTEETRRVREELQEMIRKDSARSDILTDDRIFKVRRRKREA